ncbi:MAG: transporter substrate-binding domain-containing protein [Desulfuromonadales bacterium]|nr:transporter substrate-binding domain-containing protein [Desulfuromonadales bacterium]
MRPFPQVKEVVLRNSLLKYFPHWVLVLLFFLATVSVALAEEPDDFDAPIIVGGDHNYPPYEFIDDDGQSAGFNVELTHAVADVMGMDVEIRLGPWGRMRQGLSLGEVDVLQGMAWTSERTQEVDYSIPHAKVHQSIWIRKGSSIDSLDDLNGKNVIVMRGAVMHDFMLQHSDLHARLHPVQTLEDALRKLSEGLYDAALVAKLPGEYLVQKTGLVNIAPIAKPLVAQDYGYAVKKGNAELLARFNEGLMLLKKSGRFRLIYEKWLGVLPQPGISTDKIVRVGAMVVLPLLLVLAMTVFWSRTLRRQVALRTEALELEVIKKEQALYELEVHQQQLIQADKLSSLGILTSGVAHEINNPNGLILLNLPLLKKAWNDMSPILQKHFQQNGDFKLGWFSFSRMSNEIPQMLDEMQQGAERIKRIVEDLKDFTRQSSAELSESVDLSLVADTARRLVDTSLKKATHHFQADLAGNLPKFRGNSQRIEQVVVNLLLNSCQALVDREQSIELRTTLTEDGSLLLEVKDQGCGIASEHLQKLTDPFFTTNRDTGGTGLGLSISEGIVNEHSGQLKFDSVPGEGTCVSLLLPAEDKTRER